MPQIQTTPVPIQPDAITGLYAWYDASNPASVNVSSGSAVATWSDLSGNARHLSAVGTTANVKYLSNAINGHGCINITDGGRLNRANWWEEPINTRMTMFAVWKLTAANTDPIWDGTSSFWVKNGSNSPQQNYSVHNSGTHRTLENSRGDGWHTFRWTSDWDNTTYPVGLGHWAVDFGPGRVGNGGLNGGAGHDLEAPRFGSIQIAELIFFDHMLVWEELVKVQAYLDAKYNTYSALDDSENAIIALGNSTTAGGWPYYVGLHLEDIGLPVINLALSGGTINTLNSEEPEIQELLSILRTKGKRTVLTLLHGHNNMNDSGGGQAVVDHIKGPLFADIRATGAKILALTTTPWHNNDLKEVGRTVINTFLRSPDALNYVDAVFDLGATPEFGQYGDGTTTGSKAAYPELWGDDVHFTDAGNQAIADYVHQAARDLIEDTPGLLTPGSISVESTESGAVQLTSQAPTEGYGPFTYQWKRNGSNLTGKTSLSLTDSTAEGGETYVYALTVTDSAGYYLSSEDTEVEVDADTPVEPSPGRYGYLNNAETLATADRSVGGSTLQVADGSLFGSPSVEHPLRVSTFKIVDNEYVPTGIYKCEGRTGNALSINGTLEGTTDQGTSEGDTVSVCFTAGYWGEMWAAIDAGADVDLTPIEEEIADLQADVDALTTTVSGKASQSSVDALTTSLSSKASQSSVDALTTSLSGKADDSAVVKLTGNQSISGNKTFANQIAVATSINGNAPLQLANSPGSLQAIFRAGSAAWGIYLGDEPTPTFNLGGQGAGDTYFWKGGWDTAVGNVFKSANGQGTQVPLASKIADGQTADAFQVINHAGTKVSALDYAGRLAIGNLTPSAGVDIGGGKGLNVRNSVGDVVSAFDSNGFGFVDRCTFVLAQGVDLVTGTNLTKGGHVVGYAGSIDCVKIVAGSNGGSGGFTLDVNKNGTSIFSSAPSVANSTTTVQTFTPNTTSVSEDDILTIDCDSVGIGVQGVRVIVVMRVGNQ